MPPGDQVILDQLRSCKAAQHSIISYDPNIRRQLLSSPAAGRARAETFIAAAHIVKASEDDLHWLYPTSTIHDVARCWLQLGATLIIITHGSRGATAFTAAGQRIEHPTPKVSVVDTIGAGDAFTAGLLHSLLNQPRARDQLRDPTNDGTLAEDDIRALLNAATTSAALTCTRAGAEPPYKVEFAVAPGQNQP